MILFLLLLLGPAVRIQQLPPDNLKLDPSCRQMTTDIQRVERKAGFG
jgi:hypothetical protein